MGAFVDYLLEHGAAEDTALVDAGRARTFGEVRQGVTHLSGHLAARGVPAGSRVAVLGPSSFFWVVAYLAGLSSHVVVPLSDTFDAPRVRAQLERLGATAVFLDRRVEQRYAAAIPDGLVVITDADLEGEDASEAVPVDSRASDLDDDALLLFTSGTTAAAKVVRLTHRNLIANTTSIVEYLGLRRDDRMLVVLPFFYCFGLSLLHTHLRVGGSVSLCPSFVFPEVVLDQMEREHCTGFAGVPSTYQLLLRASSLGSRELPALRHLQQAGGKLPPALVEELVAAQPGARLFVMYGQTEATSRLSYLDPELVLVRPGSIGRGIPGVRLEVLDADGRPVAPGQTGEIHAHGDNVSPGYLDDPVGTADKFPGGSLRTGDLATVDDDGFIYIVDRADDFIKSWGHRISSQEVEACVLRMPELVSAAAVGVPDPRAGEAVTLVVTVRPGVSVTEDDVLRCARRGLPRHMVPARVVIIDALPLNGNGKVDKRAVRRMLTPVDVPEPATHGVTE